MSSEVRYKTTQNVIFVVRHAFNSRYFWNRYDVWLGMIQAWARLMTSCAVLGNFNYHEKNAMCAVICFYMYSGLCRWGGSMVHTRIGFVLVSSKRIDLLALLDLAVTGIRTDCGESEQ